jgi:xanthine dehydrogenase accessory factor
MNDLRIYQKALSLLEAGSNIVLATVIFTSGSTPGKVAYKMIVGDQKGLTEGTIGGGATEGEIIRIAQNSLSETGRRVIRFDLRGTENTEMGICGGTIEYLVETFDPSDLPLFRRLSKILAEGQKGVLVSMLSPCQSPEKFLLDLPEKRNAGIDPRFTAEAIERIQGLIAREESAKIILADGAEAFVEVIAEQPNVYLFGAGHLSQAICHYAKRLNFRITVCDDRSEFANIERFSEADQILAENAEGLFTKIHIQENSYIVIVTRGHQHDERILEQAVKSPMKYIGMIGSRRKTSVILRRLYERGVPAETLRRVYSPIGLDIGAVTPEEIAVSIVSEMVKIRRRGPAGEIRHLQMGYPFMSDTNP